MSNNAKKKLNIEEDIKLKYTIIKRAKKEMTFVMIFVIIFLLLAFWSFSGHIDPLLPNIGPTVRNIMKFISVIGVIVSIYFIVIYLVGINRARKMLLKEIDYYKK